MNHLAPPPAHTARYLACLRWSTPRSYERSQHESPHTDLLLITRGVFHGLTTQGEEYAAQPGDLVYRPGGVPRDTWNDPTVPSTCLWLMFDWRTPIAGLPEILHDTEGRIHTLLQWLSEETIVRGRGEYEAFSYGILQAVLSELERLGRRPVPPLVRQVRAVMVARMKERLTVDDLAAVAGLSRFHFCRRYRALAGSTPMTDLQRLRADALRRLLLTTDLPLKAIALQVGLADASHVARLCRAHFGMTARELRHGGAAPAALG